VQCALQFDRFGNSTIGYKIKILYQCTLYNRMYDINIEWSISCYKWNIYFE